MPTQAQYDAVRYDLDTDAASMSDAEIDSLYVRAESVYGAGNASVEPAVRVIAIRRLLVAATKRVDYKQNQSEEKLSQMRAGLQDLLDYWTDELEASINGAVSAVRFGGLKRYIPHLVEYPDDFPYPASGRDVSRLE